MGNSQSLNGGESKLSQQVRSQNSYFGQSSTFSNVDENNVEESIRDIQFDRLYRYSTQRRDEIGQYSNFQDGLGIRSSSTSGPTQLKSVISVQNPSIKLIGSVYLLTFSLKSEAPGRIVLSSNGMINSLNFEVNANNGQQNNSIDEEAKTFCGTAEYIAPEVLRHEKYSFPIDWWAMGILLYEILYETTPFFDDHQTKMFENILNKDPDLPKFGHKTATDLIRQLLNKDPAKRPTVDQIKAHPFFKGLDWDKVYNKQYKPTTFQTVSEYQPTGFANEFTQETPVDSDAQSQVQSGAFIPDFSFGTPDPHLSFKFTT